MYTHTHVSGHIHVVHSVATSYTLSIKTVKTIKIKVKIKIKTHTYLQYVRVLPIIGIHCTPSRRSTRLRQKDE